MKRKEYQSEHDARMDRFMLYGGNTDDATEAGVTYLGNSYLVKYNPGKDTSDDACAAICQAFIDGAAWARKRMNPRDSRTEKSHGPD